MSDSKISTEPNEVLVWLNGELIGALAEADAEKGYVVQYSWDGSKVTFRGQVKIIMNGKEAVRAEAPEGCFSCQLKKANMKPLPR